MIQSRHRILITIMISTFATGCTESGFKDAMGYSKFSPDETQVSTNQALSMPPSLQLRPPAAGGAVVQDGAAPKSLFAPQPVTSTPPQYGAPDPNQVPAPSVYEPPVSTPQTVATATPDPFVQPPAAAPDVYAKQGISKVHPDGRAKTRAELLNELRKKQVEKERAKNPSYGSIFNLPNVWND